MGKIARTVRPSTADRCPSASGSVELGDEAAVPLLDGGPSSGRGQPGQRQAEQTEQTRRPPSAERAPSGSAVATGANRVVARPWPYRKPPERNRKTHTSTQRRPG